jgi:hypothetical protein
MREPEIASDGDSQMPERAALALLCLVALAPVTGLAASPRGGDAHPTPPADIAPITEAAFEQRLDDAVAEEGGVHTEEGDTLRVELPDEARVLFFTRPGHRAHPAIVAVEIVEAAGAPGIETSGWWAGDGEAFEIWFRAFERRNERLSREWQEEQGPF